MISNSLSRSCVFSACGLIAIWPIPGTIALRYFLLVFGFIVGLMYLWRSRSLLLHSNAWNLYFLLIFFVWLIVHLFFFSTERNYQLQELLGVWSRAFLSIPIGVSFGLILATHSTSITRIPDVINNVSESIVLVILFFLALNFTNFVFFITYIFEAIKLNQIYISEFYRFSYHAKTPFVVYCALSIPLSLILVHQSLVGRLQKFWMPLSIISICLSLFSIYFANTKNGFFIFALCIFQFFYLILISKSSYKYLSLKRNMFAITIIISSFIAMTYFHIMHNPSLTKVFEEIKIGTDIQKFEYWKDRIKFPHPTFEDGSEVNGSAYERSAWFTAGIHLIPKYPQGYGLLTHSFGRLAKKEWSDFNHPIIGKTYLATHSGWMDMALGVGIVGITFLWIPLGIAWWRSLMGDDLISKYVSRSIPIIFITYLTAEVAGAHFSELLIFMIAFYTGFTHMPAKTHF